MAVADHASLGTHEGSSLVIRGPVPGQRETLTTDRRNHDFVVIGIVDPEADGEVLTSINVGGARLHGELVGTTVNDQIVRLACTGYRIQRIMRDRVSGAIGRPVSVSVGRHGC